MADRRFPRAGTACLRRRLDCFREDSGLRKVAKAGPEGVREETIPHSRSGPVARRGVCLLLTEAVHPDVEPSCVSAPVVWTRHDAPRRPREQIGAAGLLQDKTTVDLAPDHAAAASRHAFGLRTGIIINPVRMRAGTKIDQKDRAATPKAPANAPTAKASTAESVRFRRVLV